MADEKVVTSENPRYDYEEFIEFFIKDNDCNRPKDSWFLGGSSNGTYDVDIYLIESDIEGCLPSMDILYFVPDSDEQYTYGVEDVTSIDNLSTSALQEGLRRALAQGLLATSDPTEIQDFSPAYRHRLPKEHQSTAVYLEGTRVGHQDFELYYVPKTVVKSDMKSLEDLKKTPGTSTGDPSEDRLIMEIIKVLTKGGGDLVSGVYAIKRTDADEPCISGWPCHGHIPEKGIGTEAVFSAAICEAIRRSIAQGFEVKLDKCCAKALEGLTSPHVSSDPKQVTNSSPAVPTHPQEVHNAMSSSSTTAITPTNSNINKAAPKRFNNVTVSESKDEQIHLPAGMSKSQAREWLTTLERNEEQVINWSETIDAYPLDGALALQRVLESRFGGATKTGAIGWFGMEIPPFMVSIEVGVNETAHVPWGYFTIPIMPEHKIHASIEEKDKQLYFQLTAAIKRKYQPMMDQIVQQVRAEVKNGSIYKGQAFRLKFPTDNEAAQSNFNPSDFAPRFIDVAKKTDTLILSESVKEQVETYLFTPVVATELTRTHGIPLKRGILLEGKYGTGKTLTAAVLSALCVANGWTFIYLQNVVDLERAMRFARRYEPAVIFSEDIDTVMKTAKDGARDEEMNKILNTIDGVDMKNIEQMVVLTTNYVDLISKAMLRPGRLDAVITVEPPDQQAVVQLMRHYSAGLLSDEKDANLQEAAQLLAGNIPSVIREVVERSKLASIRRAVSENHKDVKINGKDVLVAAKGIAAHIKLLEEARPDKRSDIEKAADRLGTHVAEALQTISERSKPTNGSSTKVMAPAPSPSTKSLPQG